MRMTILFLLLLSSSLQAQTWAPSTDFYKAKVFAGKGADPIPMNGYMVKADGWPELIKVSDRHTQWGHAVATPGSLGSIVPGFADQAVGRKGEKRDAFSRTVAYELPNNQKASFTFSNLSPALWMDSDAKTFTAFKAKAGPKCIAYASKAGVGYVSEVGGSVAGADLQESWILIWHGADQSYLNSFVPTFLHASPNPLDKADYDKFVAPQSADAPFLVVFQHRPSRITMQADGIAVEFDGPAGTTAFLPIGGFRWYRGVDTAKWVNNLPAEVAQKCQAWNKYLKFMPRSLKEEYSVTDQAVSVRTTFEFAPIADDWKTAGVRFAPVPSATGLALVSGLKNLATTPEKLVNVDYPTLTGALVGFENVDSYTVTFAGWQPYVTLPAPSATKHADPRVQAKLEAHLTEMISAGHLAPFDSFGGTLQYSFWGNPGDLASTLIAAYRHVGPELQKQIDEYLRQENAKYSMLKYGWTPPREGARRESYPVDLDMKDVLGRRHRTDEGPRIENLLGLWNYSLHFKDWDWLAEQWPQVQQIVRRQDEQMDWEMGFHNGGVADLNARIKGLIGYRQLAMQKKDVPAVNEATFLLTQSLINRYAFAKLSEYRFLSNQFYVPKEFDLPRFHARNAHKFNIFLPAYKKGANYQTAPQVGLVGATDRYISEIGNFWHDHSIWAFVDLTPPLAKFLQDATSPELKNYLACIDEGLPTWYVTRAENLHAIGEDAYFSPYMAWPIFQARAMIYHEPAASLAKYVDLPYAKGDLYYLQDLIAVLEAD